MRGTAGGLLTTVLMLTLLQAVVSSAGATGRLGSLLTSAGTLVEHLASPAIAAIPDLRAGQDRNSTPALYASPAPGVAAAVPAPLPAQPPRLPNLIPA